MLGRERLDEWLDLLLAQRRAGRCQLGAQAADESARLGTLDVLGPGAESLLAEKRAPLILVSRIEILLPMHGILAGLLFHRALVLAHLLFRE